MLALHVWLDSFPDDFRDPPQHPALQQLQLFCKQHLPDSELAVKVRFRLDRFQRDDHLIIGKKNKIIVHFYKNVYFKVLFSQCIVVELP